MTDEEKKAYDNLIMLKYFTMEKEDKQAIDTILNLIEKQSKEIESKQKEAYNFGYRNGCNDTSKFNDKTFIRIDKIKAKIEEIDKVLNEDIYVIDGHYDDRYYRYLQDKHILQSLL